MDIELVIYFHLKCLSLKLRKEEKERNIGILLKINVLSYLSNVGNSIHIGRRNFTANGWESLSNGNNEVMSLVV